MLVSMMAVACYLSNEEQDISFVDYLLIHTWALNLLFNLLIIHHLILRDYALTPDLEIILTF